MAVRPLRTCGACRGTVDYMDVMAWTDFVLEQYPQIDPARLGVMGGSYGGYMTNWIITHTDRFRAAVSMRSISNITADYGVTDCGVWGTPEFTAEHPGATTSFCGSSPRLPML